MIDRILYPFVRGILGLGLGFYFRRIDRFHAHHVPVSGPVLFTSNHPNSLTDAWIVGATVPRKVHFVATVQLFRLKPLKWFLLRCGVIPINRAKDDPRGMRSVADTFEACYRVLERGEAIGIFPEGVTYDDSRMREVKSGAARMALELEHRHHGKLGLKIVPVGLTYSAKELYRSDVLANFGEPILVGDFLDGYSDRRKEAIYRLTAEIEERIQSLILHIPDLKQARVVEGVKRLFLDELVVGDRVRSAPISRHAEELLVAQRITVAVDRVFRMEPERATAFAVKLDFYERWLSRLRLSEETLRVFRTRDQLVAQSVLWTAVAVLGTPIALYGWIHRLLPHVVVMWAAGRFVSAEKRKAQASTARIASGIVVYGAFYSLFVALVHAAFGLPASFWYGLSLPLASLLAFHHRRELHRLKAAFRTVDVLVRAPFAAKKLVALRMELINEIESVHEVIARQGEAGKLRSK